MWDISDETVTTDSESNLNGAVVFRFVGLEVKLLLNKLGALSSCHLHATERVDTLLEEFGMSDSNSRDTPAVSEHRKEWRERNLKGEKPTRDATVPEPTFLLRACLGSLTYIACLCRPDVAEAVSAAARCPYRDLAIRMCRRILRYLAGTRDWGIGYSDKSRELFESTYRPLMTQSIVNGVFPSAVTFSDASFGSCPSTGRSVSGTLLCLFGTPYK